MRRPTSFLTIATLVGSLVVGGCSHSPPLRYYTLTEVPASKRISSMDSTIPIRLDRVTIPAELDRSELVRRVDTTRLQLIEDQRWAAPLEDTIRRVLSGDLASRLPAGMVANPYEPSVGEKRQSLSVDIEEFYGDATCAVTLRAAWSLKQPDMQSSRGADETQVASDGTCNGAGALPAVMSQALAQLSDRIAAAVTSPSRP